MLVGPWQQSQTPPTYTNEAGVQQVDGFNVTQHLGHLVCPQRDREAF